MTNTTNKGRELREEFERNFYQCWNDTELPNPENVRSFMWNFMETVLKEQTLNEIEIEQAIARAYTHKKNSHKILDVDLLNAIVKEIKKLK